VLNGHNRSKCVQQCSNRDPYQATFYDRDHDEGKEDDRDDVIFFVEIDPFQSVLNFFAITGLSGDVKPVIT